MFQAMGPIDIDDRDAANMQPGDFTYQLKYNPHTWNDKYAMLYLDQPIGTGFSFVEDPKGFVKTDEEAAGHIATAIPNILHRYGKAANPLYVFGVSYGGKLAPLVAETLLLVEEKDTRRSVNLKGIGIGNGLIDAQAMTRSYSKHFHMGGYIDKAIADEVHKLQEEANTLLVQGKTCEALKYIDEDGIILKKVHSASGIVNWYDLREAFTPAKYFSPVTAALWYVDHIQKLLPIGKTKKWSTANGGMNYTVYNNLKCAIARSTKPQINGLLEKGIRVLVYHGQDDGMVPLMSTREWISTLTHKAAVDLQQHHQKPWSVKGQTVGYWRADPATLITDVMILNAGHLAVKDQPAVARAMLERWITEGTANVKKKKKAASIAMEFTHKAMIEKQQKKDKRAEAEAGGDPNPAPQVALLEIN